MRTDSWSLVHGTPVEEWIGAFGLLVKREDLCSPLPGPPFSKMRGVMAHIKSRPEPIIGVLDTYHSQAGWAVAHACATLGKECINFYPEYKAEIGPRPSQVSARGLGALLVPLSAGRSAILYHRARRWLRENYQQGRHYMMPNALKLKESIAETAQEVSQTSWPSDRVAVVVPSSSATILSGVVRGLNLLNRSWKYPPIVICHLGYSRSEKSVRQYIERSADTPEFDYVLKVIDEGYAYRDKAHPGPTPNWPCNIYYDLKAFRWWLREGRSRFGRAVFWNIG